MKKLLLTALAITSLISINAQAQPITQNIIINTDPKTNTHGNLMPHVTGGMPPYTFKRASITGPMRLIKGHFVLHSNGSFEYVPEANFLGKQIYHYQAIDANGTSSNIASITIIILDSQK